MIYPLFVWRAVDDFQKKSLMKYGAHIPFDDFIEILKKSPHGNKWLIHRLNSIWNVNAIPRQVHVGIANLIMPDTEAV